MSTDPEEIARQVQEFIESITGKKVDVELKRRIRGEHDGDEEESDFVVTVMGTRVETIHVKAKGPRHAADLAMEYAFEDHESVIDVRHSSAIISVFDLAQAARDYATGDNVMIKAGHMNTDGTITPIKEKKARRKARLDEQLDPEKKAEYIEKMKSDVAEIRAMRINPPKGYDRSMGLDTPQDDEETEEFF